MMRTILIIVLGLFIAQNVSAQVDSLIFKLGDYGQIVIISSNLITEKQESFGLDASFRKFYMDFKKIDKTSFRDKNQIIKYSDNNYGSNSREISIEDADNKTDIFYFQEGKEQYLLSGKFKLELLLDRKVVIFINSLEDLEKIEQLSLDSLYLQSLEHFQSQNLNKRISYKIFYSAENNQISKSSNMILAGKFNDYLLLFPTVGMSIINSRIAPEWGASFEFDFRKKGLANIKFGLNYSTMYLFNKDNIFDISSYSFLSLNYYFKYKDDYAQKLSVGYLVNKTSNDFNGKTWNAYYSASIKKIGFKIGGIYTKNTEGKYVVLPSVGFDFSF